MDAHNRLFAVVMGFVVGVALASSPDARAAAQRTFVSSTGSDASPCSLAQPCRSFAAAIAQTLTTGEVIVLDSAGYGPVIVTKAVSLIAPEGVYAGISVASGNGVDINAPGAIVVLRGLAINGIGGASQFGVRLAAATGLRIERCVISNMGANGIHVSSPGAETTVVDSTIRGNGNGIAVVVNGALRLDRVRSEQNGGHGVALSISSNSAALTASVSDSTLAANGQDGINSAPGSNGEIRVQIDRSVLSHNGSNGVSGTGTTTGSVSRMTITHSAINNNQGHGVLALGGPGSAFVFLSYNGFESNVGNSVRSEGNLAIVSLTGNTAQAGGIQPEWQCTGGATLVSLGNNFAEGIGESPSGCYSAQSGV